MMIKDMRKLLEDAKKKLSNKPKLKNFIMLPQQQLSWDSINEKMNNLRKKETPKVLDAIRFWKIWIVKYRNWNELKYYIWFGFWFDESKDAKFIVQNWLLFILPEKFYSLWKENDKQRN